MSQTITAVLLGAVAMGSWVASLIFLRYWRLTGDAFFIWFAIAFGVDAVTRLALALANVSSETEPLFYLSRLVTFGLIIVAIALKNRPGSPQ